MTVKDTKVLPKRERGRPPKTNENDANAIILKIDEQLQRFNAKCADNLHILLEVIYGVAVSPKTPLKDKVSAAKYCIEQAEKFLKDDDGKKKVVEEPGAKESKAKATSAVISLKAVD